MLKNEHGSTLALCVIIMAMLSIFVVGISGILVANRKSKIDELSEERGFYLSDSCIAMTEARLQTKVINTIAEVLDAIDSDEVSLTFNDGTEVYDKDSFNRRYIRYAAAAFSATTPLSGGDADALARNRLRFDPDPNATGDESISSKALTSALAVGSNEGYVIESDIENGSNINTNYDNFYTVVDECYPAPEYDEENNVWTVENYDQSVIDNKVSQLNTGLLRVTYTIRNKEDKIVEKVRVTYTFDLFHAFMNICEEQSNRIYPPELAEGETPPPTEPYDVDLKIKVSREYLLPND